MKRINIAFMKVNSIGGNCTMSLSQAAQIGRHSNLKRNAGFGEASSDGSIYLMPESRVYDQDIYDDNEWWLDLERRK